jgi:hypothetical protein
MYGDDTWVSLFPPDRWFTSAAPFPSLNVKDIDGCDDHVSRHLATLFGPSPQPALVHNRSADTHAAKRGGGAEPAAAAGGNRTGTTLAIGHFLGVDHVGHR